MRKSAIHSAPIDMHLRNAASRSCQLSALDVILKFEDLEVWKRSSRLCEDLYKHFQDIMGMLLLTTDN